MNWRERVVRKLLNLKHRIKWRWKLKDHRHLRWAVCAGCGRTIWVWQIAFRLFHWHHGGTHWHNRWYSESRYADRCPEPPVFSP